MLADTESTEDASQLIGVINDINVQKKYLNIQMSTGFEIDMLKNKSINFNVMVQHLSSGAKYILLR